VPTHTATIRTIDRAPSPSPTHNKKRPRSKRGRSQTQLPQSARCTPVAPTELFHNGAHCTIVYSQNWDNIYRCSGLWMEEAKY